MSMQAVQTFRAKAGLSPILTQVLDEVIALGPNVMSWSYIPTSGSAACRHSRIGGPRGYDIRCQQGNVGNIVHELIHVAVNEAYDQDFINFHCPFADPPERKLNAMGLCINEAARQDVFFRAGQASVARISSKLGELTPWANAASELTQAQRTMIADKLLYGARSPHTEYHTVITQTLVWLVEWGYPKKQSGALKPVVNALYEELEKAVGAAYNDRQAAKPRSKLKAMIGPQLRARRAAMGLE
jgi:hypothetical protein